VETIHRHHDRQLRAQGVRGGAAVARAAWSALAALHETSPGSPHVVDGSDATVRFGVTQGLALYLYGTDLSDETKATEDANELIPRLPEALGDNGAMMSRAEGPTETALYFCGKAYDALAAPLALVVVVHPLGQQSWVEQIAQVSWFVMLVLWLRAVFGCWAGAAACGVSSPGLVWGGSPQGIVPAKCMSDPSG